MSPSASVPPFPIRVPDRTGVKVRGIKDWTPPHRREEMEHLLERLRAGLPVDAAFDDIDAVLGGGPAPSDERIDELTDRFRGNLMVLVDRVLERQAGDLEERVRLVARARDLRQEGPGVGVSPLAHLRRLAFTAQELLEILLAEESAT
ncbi:DUF6415 family natural product biosynthesis protein [Streptomyces sp. NPDC006259]|uniref:DUF6415 family natural product biosynthesis protein n=1 Tax=Streptomyces sp. NPDC006259 TaxID=3364740 RepID=UPI0036ACAEF5